MRSKVRSGFLLKLFFEFQSAHDGVFNVLGEDTVYSMLFAAP